MTCARRSRARRRSKPRSGWRASSPRFRRRRFSAFGPARPLTRLSAHCTGVLCSGLSDLPVQMDQAGITHWVTTSFAGVDAAVGSQEAGSPEISWDDTFFIYDPERNREGAQRLPFATIVTKDYGDFTMPRTSTGRRVPPEYRTEQRGRMNRCWARPPSTTSPRWTGSCRTRSTEL